MLISLRGYLLTFVISRYNSQDGSLEVIVRYGNHFRLVFLIVWLVVILAVLWAIVNLYLPIFGGFLTRTQTWGMVFLIVLLSGLSIVGHVISHRYIARRIRSQTPGGLPVLLFGDVAQAWLPAASPWGEAMGALAGPLFNLVLAGLAFLIWNAQLNTYLTLSMLFLGGFNTWMFVINLIPGFPFDGGRLARAITWGLLDRPGKATRLALNFGIATAIALAAWSIVLFYQKARFSLETGGTSLAFALLVGIALWLQPVSDTERVGVQPAPGSSGFRQGLRILLAGLLILGMFAAASCLLLTNNGLEAPGFALSVEPMISVPPAYLHVHPGTFILTSVVSQAPIVGAEWLAGHLTPAIKIVPPETIVPENTTPQEVARQGYQMLDESETTAIVVGLQMAGFKATMIGKGVRVDSILPESPALNVLLPGDVITGLNSQPVRTLSDLMNQLKKQEPEATVRLQILRNQNSMEVAVTLMPPAEKGGSPRLGITIESAGFDAQYPIPVKINAQKIVGGPSAGLMFTLTIYNMLSSTDLTGGRHIAGTGTINLDGTVGPIGGVQQKVVAAELAGAEYFLSPVENYPDAVSVARHIKVIEIANVDQAVQFLHSLR